MIGLCVENAHVNMATAQTGCSYDSLPAVKHPSSKEKSSPDHSLSELFLYAAIAQWKYRVFVAFPIYRVYNLQCNV